VTERNFVARRAWVLAGAVSALLAACGDRATNDDIRGRGLMEAETPAAVTAAIYEAATRAAFDITPDLVLLAEPRYLPRGGGEAGGDPVPDDVLAAMRRRGLIRGTCEPPHDGSRAVPVCEARAPGYVVRFSEVFSASSDTVQVHFSALRFRTRPDEPAEALSFERAYQLTGSGQRWRVVREARVPQG
jgi:hypothetical protein